MAAEERGDREHAVEAEAVVAGDEDRGGRLRHVARRRAALGLEEGKIDELLVEALQRYLDLPVMPPDVEAEADEPGGHDDGHPPAGGELEDRRRDENARG